MAYEDQQVYAKYQGSKKEDCGCEDCSDSKCGCCPVGLVAVYNTDGDQIACLTPADADEYNANNKMCKEGFIALYDKTQDPPLFLSCVASDEFAAIYAVVNPD